MVGEVIQGVVVWNLLVRMLGVRGLDMGIRELVVYGMVVAHR